MIGSIGSPFVLPNAQGQNPQKSGGTPNVLQELTPEQQKQLNELKKTDQKVRAHEQAHKTVGGPYAGAIQYETVTGPDGREYAVAGEVPIDSSPVPNNPEATIRKMDVVVRAALAPPEPSSQDYAVARAAQQARLEAQRELLALQEQERTKSDDPLSLSPIEEAIARYQEAQNSAEGRAQNLKNPINTVT